MKLFSTFLLIFILVLSSCDSKDRARKTTEQKLKQSKLTDSIFLLEKYIPELYSEVIVDTTLNNNIKVHIKSYTDMSNNVLNDFKIDTIHYKYFYRELISDLKVTLDGKTIFNETINKSYFNDSEDNFFWNKALMIGLYINISILTFLTV